MNSASDPLVDEIAARVAGYDEQRLLDDFARAALPGAMRQVWEQQQIHRRDGRKWSPADYGDFKNAQEVAAFISWKQAESMIAARRPRPQASAQEQK